MTSARLTVDLAALAQNYRDLRQRQGHTVPADRAAAVVKANAYGLGVATVSECLWQEGCRRFFVATAVEGLELRQVLPDASIYVFAGATPETMDALHQGSLIPVLNTPQQCLLWSSNAQSAAALHIDTGMNRLGLPWDTDFTQLPALTLDLVMTHFARADEASHPMREHQQQQFAHSVAGLTQCGWSNFWISANNSAGALTDKTLQATDPAWVDRLGVALYGVNPHEELDSVPAGHPMATVATLEAQVLQIRAVQPGAFVGYASTYEVQQPGRLATISAGYADGVPRLLSNQGHVYFRGERLPMVGRISMDSLVVALPESCDLVEGEWVEIFGPNLSLTEVATQAQTISYEILTGLSARVQREI